MSVERVRHLYEYQFALNRKIWDYCIENLTIDQLLEDVGFSHGSVRNLFVHIMGVDERWFSYFRKAADPGHLDPSEFPEPDVIRKKWDIVEDQMREVLSGLADKDLEKTFQGNMMVWHVLSHIVNHGTHHRAQLGVMLVHHGLKPLPQDYVFYVMGRLLYSLAESNRLLLCFSFRGRKPPMHQLPRLHLLSGALKAHIRESLCSL